MIFCYRNIVRNFLILWTFFGVILFWCEDEIIGSAGNTPDFEEKHGNGSFFVISFKMKSL